MKKFVLGLLTTISIGTFTVPNNAGAVKADSYYEEFNPQGESYQRIIDLGYDYVLNASTFNRLFALGNQINSMSEACSLAYQQINLDGSDEGIIRAKKVLVNVKKQRSSLQQEFSFMSSESIPKIFSNYSKGIANYESALTYLEKYRTTRSSQNFNSYLSQVKAGYNNSYYGSKESLSQYQYYMGLALNILSQKE